MSQESNHIFQAGGTLHLSEFLLLIDSDTRIPEDCLLPILTELRAAPHVAFVQCLTYPMQQVSIFTCRYPSSRGNKNVFNPRVMSGVLRQFKFPKPTPKMLSDSYLCRLESDFLPDCSIWFRSFEQQILSAQFQSSYPINPDPFRSTTTGRTPSATSHAWCMRWPSRWHAAEGTQPHWLAITSSSGGQP